MYCTCDTESVVESCLSQEENFSPWQRLFQIFSFSLCLCSLLYFGFLLYGSSKIYFDI